MKLEIDTDKIIKSLAHHTIMWFLGVGFFAGLAAAIATGSMDFPIKLLLWGLECGLAFLIRSAMQ